MCIQEIQKTHWKRIWSHAENLAHRSRWRVLVKDSWPILVSRRWIGAFSSSSFFFVSNPNLFRPFYPSVDFEQLFSIFPLFYVTFFLGFWDCSDQFFSTIFLNSNSKPLNNILRIHLKKVSSRVTFFSQFLFYFWMFYRIWWTL